METVTRIRTHDDELHDWRRLLARARDSVPEAPVALGRLIERARDTRDP